MTSSASLSRRQFTVGVSALATVAATLPSNAQTTPAQLVVVGGGFGGATAARWLKRLLPGASVTLVEPESTYLSCPFSNLVIGGERDIEQQAFGYDGVRASGVTVITDRVTRIDADRRQLILSGGDILPYDRAIVAPGVSFRPNGLEGYDDSAQLAMPHAWKAGDQTTRLFQQLNDMEDGGLVVMSVPTAPYRCPPGPYERASLIAHFLQTRKPKSKLLIFDAKDSFSKQPLFLAEWGRRYPDHLEWRSATDDGRVGSVSARDMTLATDFETIRADVANVIPPQMASDLAQSTGLADATGWCPINPLTFESTLLPNVHVIGDATIAAPMPKSAFSANLQAKVCAIQIARVLLDEAPEPTVLANTCYSYVAPDAAISIAGVYSNADGRFSTIDGAGGLSPVEATAVERSREAAQANDWFAAITRETFG